MAKKTNQMFMGNDGICYTRIWNNDKMHIIRTDKETAKAYKEHLSRTSCLWKPGEEKVKEGGAARTHNNRHEQSAFKPRYY